MASTINLLRLLADPTRLRLLLLLEQEELSVAELQQILGMGQSRISSHLAQLKRAGVVADRRVGKNVYYGANHNGQNAKRERVAEITRLLARELAEGSRDRTSLKLVLQKRQDKARKYFDELAGKFGRGYVPGRSWQALAHTLITLLPPLTVADLGAGEGTLSQLLAKRARKVIAIDNSPKMVEFGSQLAKKHGFKNLEYRLGDIEDPPIAKDSVDLAILSQALHHAIHPERAIRRCSPDFETRRAPGDSRSIESSIRKGARTLCRPLARIQRSASCTNSSKKAVSERSRSALFLEKNKVRISKRFSLRA